MEAPPSRLQSYVTVYHAILALIAMLIPGSMYLVNEHVNSVVMQHDIARLQQENRDMQAALKTFEGMKTQIDFIADYYHKEQRKQ